MSKQSLVILVVVCLISIFVAGVFFTFPLIDWDKVNQKLEEKRAERDLLIQEWEEERENDNFERLRLRDLKDTVDEEPEEPKLPLSIRVALKKLDENGCCHVFYINIHCFTDYLNGYKGCIKNNELIYYEEIDIS